jgi:hypothetical protein
MSVRTEVVVDHIEKDCDVSLVGGVDKCFEILGSAITGIRREQQHPVVTPVPSARKIGDGH